MTIHQVNQTVIRTTLLVGQGPAGPQGPPGNSGTPDWNDILNKPAAFPPTSHSHAFSELTGKPTTVSGYGITDAITNVDSNGTITVSGTGSSRNVSLNLASLNTWTGRQTFEEALIRSLRMTTSLINTGRTLLLDESVVILDPPVLTFFDCAVFTDQSSCETESFCSWDVWDCSLYSSQATCDGNPNCTWNQLTCEEISDQPTCEGHAECTWDAVGGMCEGGPISATGMCDGGSGEACTGGAFDEDPATLSLPTAPDGKNYWLKNAGTHDEPVFVKRAGITLFTIDPHEGLHIVAANGGWYGLSRGTFN